LVGKTFLYEFPATIEQLIKKEITDIENGWGFKIFDPEDGHNLIVSIGAKKPDKVGKVWPDYSLTTFAKKATPMCEDIQAAMESTQDIMEYVKNSLKTPEEHATILKSDQFERFMGIKSTTTKASSGAPPKVEVPKVEVPKTSTKPKETPKEESKPQDDDIDSLLADFDN
jgi:hypothetical protein